MSVRFCLNCAAEVEVSQGACLLGHTVGHQPSTGSLAELRAEVDKAFADARLQVASVLEPAPATDPAATISTVPRPARSIAVASPAGPSEALVPGGVPAVLTPPATPAGPSRGLVPTGVPAVLTPPATPAGPSRGLVPTGSPAVLTASTAGSPSTPPVLHTPPPPPPPLSTTTAVMAAGLADTRISGHDPIAEFAPAPRMDWGPSKEKRLKRPSLRRRSA